MKRYFIAGLLVWIPLGITLWILHLIINTMDQSLLLLPSSARPEAVFGRAIPGVGAVLTLLIVFLTGVFAANFFGRRLLAYWESVLVRIPVVKTIYTGVKQVSDTLFSSQGQAFRKALLVQYPHAGSWTIAFQTGVPNGEVAQRLSGDHVSLYVPTTPNPTSGFFLVMARKDVIELDMSVDAALKYIISMGVVAPNDARKAETAADAHALT